MGQLASTNKQAKKSLNKNVIIQIKFNHLDENENVKKSKSLCSQDPECDMLKKKKKNPFKTRNKIIKVVQV
jgi:hypothetical protein